MTTFTRYRLTFPTKHSLSLASVISILPPTMAIAQTDEGVILSVESQTPEDPSTTPQVTRELDRVFFFTVVRVQAEMERRTAGSSLSNSTDIQGNLPGELTPLVWTQAAELQARFWRLACDAKDSSLKIMLFFQIIELTHPKTNCAISYPAYKSPTQAPHPRTEAKLLRHLVAHTGQPQSQTELYLTYLGLPNTLNNVSHPAWQEIIDAKVDLVAQQAALVLRTALS
ncbi:hypothetical protein [Mitsuaria sp. GD03876]|uniref:hypothetical protein n=1 Tax=Mitsuaria sp. GD03876 TaxID=2975399 RepID=UPI00244873F0|nr:hypothetical protein [Mitsuaria sp. GD03876]MDH0866607.1 hypothetical protein [Mitsuaria sp. GD03876]